MDVESGIENGRWKVEGKMKRGGRSRYVEYVYAGVKNVRSVVRSLACVRGGGGGTEEGGKGVSCAGVGGGESGERERRYVR